MMAKRQHSLVFLAGLLGLIPACSQSAPAASNRSQSSKPISASTRAQKEPTDDADEEGDYEAFTAASCGVERWAIKTGTDSGAKKINTKTPRSTTLATLIKIKPPSTIPSNSRVTPTETTDWKESATLVEFTEESDSDYHLVLKSGSTTMIAEIPDPACVGSGSPFKAAITATRSAFNKKYHVTSSWTTVNVPVVVTGIGFFDYKHGQTGVAPNAIELHPVLNVTFVKAAPSAFGMTMTDRAISIGQGTSGSVTVGTAVRGRAVPPARLYPVGLPRGVTASFSRGTWAANWLAASASVPGRLYPTRVMFRATRSAAPGDYTVRIYGTGAGTTLWTEFVLTVVNAGVPDFYLAANPATVEVAPGHSVSIPVFVRPVNGYRGRTYFALNGLPPFFSAALPSTLGPGVDEVVLRIKAGRSAPAGGHSVTIGAVDGSLSQILTLAVDVVR
jgi:hypothetical protein